MPFLRGSTQEKAKPEVSGPTSEVCGFGYGKALNAPAGAGVPDPVGSDVFVLH
jgi:hypothetical protein